MRGSRVFGVVLVLFHASSRLCQPVLVMHTVPIHSNVNHSKSSRAKDQPSNETYTSSNDVLSRTVPHRSIG